jgi:hypothetical protein
MQQRRFNPKEKTMERVEVVRRLGQVRPENPSYWAMPPFQGLNHTETILDNETKGR